MTRTIRTLLLLGAVTALSGTAVAEPASSPGFSFRFVGTNYCVGEVATDVACDVRIDEQGATRITTVPARNPQAQPATLCGEGGVLPAFLCSLTKPAQQSTIGTTATRTEG